MRKLFLFSLTLLLPFMLSAQTKIRLTVDGERSMTATLVDNDATSQLISLLDNGPITIEMNDYGGFEKVGELPAALPTSNKQITTVPGDIMLYQGRNIVIFYGSNSWSYTPLGKIDGSSATTLRDFLGSGNVKMTISNVTAGLEEMVTEDDATGDVYDVKGQLITQRPLPPGLYIVNGKKFIVH